MAGREIQGQGIQTAEKQYGLNKVLGQLLSIIGNIKGKAARGEYDDKPAVRDAALKDILYVDMNAGSGWNDKVNCIGSPLLFLDEAFKHGYGKDIVFIEKESARVSLLMDRLGGKKEGVQVLCGDNYQLLPGIVKAHGKSYGLIYCDPDGPSNLLFDELGKLSRQSYFYFMDVLIRISATDLKRAKNGLNRFGTKNGHDHLVGKYPDLKTAMGMIKKKKWCIREPIPGDPSQWTFLFATNWPQYKELAGIGFYDIASKRGREILDRLTYTAPELRELAKEGSA